MIEIPDDAQPKALSVALIVPDAKRRKSLAIALAGPRTTIVREFGEYPRPDGPDAS